jgi:hypothetical protein
MKWAKFALASMLLVSAAVFTAVKLGSQEVRQLQNQVNQLQQERQKLVEYAGRLSATRRVAQVDVIRRYHDDAGNPVVALLWQEIGPQGALGRPVAVEATGNLVYFEALVIKFVQQYVGEGDPERGTSLAMFRRIFGDRQTPESAPDLDRAARPPVTTTGPAAGLEKELWAKFWDLIDDPQLAAKYGVRVAQIEAPAVPVQPGQIWEVSLDAAGGLNLKQIPHGDIPADGRAAAQLSAPAKP